ncbi:MAG: DUF3159 domain-containing protein [Actinocrinis sp.]
MSAFPHPETAPPVFTPQPGPVPPAGGESERQEAAAVPDQRYGAPEGERPSEQGFAYEPGPTPPGYGTQEADAHDAQAAAYGESILGAFGGKRGLFETGLPSVVFIIVYTATTRLNPSLWSAAALAVVLTIVRLVQKDKLQHALGGLFGVIVCVLFAKFTGQAKNFYLPGVLLNIGEAILFTASALVRWPVAGVVLGPITGEMTTWREQPERLKAYTLATWLLAAMFALRVAIEVPLYLANQITALGAAKVVLGYPLYIGVLFVCWRIIKRVPLTKVQATESQETQ